MERATAFAQALKQRRKALDLTQQELAHQVGCAAVTIQRIEQGTLRPSRQEESLALYRELRDAHGIAECLFFLGTLAYSAGNFRRAGELLEESLMRFRASGDIHGVAMALIHSGMVVLDQGDEGQAGAYLAESLTLLRELGDHLQIALALEVVAGLAAVQEQRPDDVQPRGLRAARLLGAVEALRETLGAPIPLHNRAYYTSRSDGRVLPIASLSLNSSWPTVVWLRSQLSQTTERR